MADYVALYSEPMLLRFDSYEGRIARGRLKTLRRQAPFRFDSMDQMFMIMDDLLDAEAFPRGMGEYRHLKPEAGDGGPAGKEDGAAGKPVQKPFCGDILFREASGEGIPDGGSPGEERGRMAPGGFKGQMAVTVRRREYGSMQGTVNVRGEKTNFRSALELMHMLHEYLETNFQAHF